jgi:putative transposase
VSERRVCRVLGQARSTQRRDRMIKSDEEALRQRGIALACEYGRYGYRRVTALLRNEGWRVNHKRGARIWRLRPHSSRGYRPPAPETHIFPQVANA